MSDFQIQLHAPLIGIATDGVVTESLSHAAAVQSQPDPMVTAASTLEQVLQKISAMEKERTINETQLKTLAAQYASEMVRSILQSDEPVVMARLSKYLDIAFEENATASGCTILVHPTVIPTLKSLITDRKTESEIEILPEDRLLPGDCRIEFADRGMIASLDAQLERINLRIERAIAGGGVA